MQVTYIFTSEELRNTVHTVGSQIWLMQVTYLKLKVEDIFFK